RCRVRWRLGRRRAGDRRAAVRSPGMRSGILVLLTLGCLDGSRGPVLSALQDGAPSSACTDAGTRAPSCGACSSCTNGSCSCTGMTFCDFADCGACAGGPCGLTCLDSSTCSITVDGKSEIHCNGSSTCTINVHAAGASSTIVCSDQAVCHLHCEQGCTASCL